ncbi:hypothetical protein HB904_17125 [Listeria booriae]|uniref:Uncharacterized protein n=1 Tax=Listeria booriae TaxID=1552123 RepID=A0A841YRK1_9LIST|nr:hypothetical protein [Listeria booriae]MBC1403141.1 hypothetical protein [Listeria booriae]MBC1617903.1 hypothetical protein [Listeria booriae]
MNEGIKYFLSKGKNILKPVVEKSVEFGVLKATGDPFVASVIGGVASSEIGSLFGKLSEDFKDRALSYQETEKIGAALAFAVMEIQENFGNGKNLRKDGFFDEDEFKRSPYDEIGEGVYIKAKEEYEIKKLKYYGNFFANIAFSEEISKEEANKLITLINVLTYRQIKLIALLSGQVIYKNLQINDEALEIMREFGSIISPKMKIPRKWDLPDRNFSAQGGMSGYSTISIYQDLMDLMRLGLVAQYKDNSIEIILDIVLINPRSLAMVGLGAQLYNLMKLDQIPENELEEILAQL